MLSRSLRTAKLNNLREAKKVLTQQSRSSSSLYSATQLGRGMKVPDDMLGPAQNANNQTEAQAARYIGGIELTQIMKQRQIDSNNLPGEKAYYDMLDNTEERQTYFSNIAAPQEGDLTEVKQVKDRINALIQQEIELSGFKGQLSEEEQTRLNSDTYEEVATKSNFYFSVDENKVNKNLKVYDFEAPGNKYRVPNIICPHQGVNIQQYVDTSSLTEDKLFEIYAYYTLMIDMHIAQVRPGIIQEKSYVPPNYNELILSNNTNVETLDNKFFDHYHRWREPASKHLYELEWDAIIAAQPTTDHYDHDKGSKYDVEWTEDQKFPHVADRLGHPEFCQDVFESVIGLERLQANPGHQLQPFAQTPSMEPDQDLDFEEGEVIYENKNIGEWIKLWKASTMAIFVSAPVFYTYEIYCADGIPSLSWASDTWMTWDIPRQFQDGGGWGVQDIRYCDDNDYMNLQYGVKRAMMRPAFTGYWMTLYCLIYSLDFNYVSKMTYNKEKDLVYVTRPNNWWGYKESIHEVHHLEQMVPAAVTAVKDHSSWDKNGIHTVKDMGQNKIMKFYKDDKYWNMDLRKEFESETNNLWVGQHDDKYNGRIFTTNGRNLGRDVNRALRNIDQEIDNAVQKHGPVTLPDGTHVDNWYDRVTDERQKLSNRATA